MLEILEEYPELICHEEGALNNMVIFDIDDTMLHIFSAKDNFWNLFVDFKKQAKEKMCFFKKIHWQPNK